jgi:hypothetical protein
MKINADIVGGGNRCTYDTTLGTLTSESVIIKRVDDDDDFQLVGLLINSLDNMYHNKQVSTDKFEQTNKLIKLYLKG